MSNDTISRKEAIRAVIRAPSYSDVSGEQYRKSDDIIDILENLPEESNQEKENNESN